MLKDSGSLKIALGSLVYIREHSLFFFLPKIQLDFFQQPAEVVIFALMASTFSLPFRFTCDVAFCDIILYVLLLVHNVNKPRDKTSIKENGMTGIHV